MSIEEYRSQMSAICHKHTDHEHKLQVACVRWFSVQFPQYAPLLFAIPNGGQRDIRVAAKLRAEGVRAGVPDLFFALPRQGKGGLFIEMKNGKEGRLSESQKTMLANLQGVGYEVAVCRSFEDFCGEICKYLRLERLFV